MHGIHIDRITHLYRVSADRMLGRARARLTALYDELKRRHRLALEARSQELAPVEGPVAAAVCCSPSWTGSQVLAGTRYRACLALASPLRGRAGIGASGGLRPCRMKPAARLAWVSSVVADTVLKACSRPGVPGWWRSWLSRSSAVDPPDRRRRAGIPGAPPSPAAWATPPTGRSLPRAAPRRMPRRSHLGHAPGPRDVKERMALPAYMLNQALIEGEVSLEHQRRSFDAELGDALLQAASRRPIPVDD